MVYNGMPNGISLSNHKEEWNYVIYQKRNETIDHIKWNKPNTDRQILHHYMFSFIFGCVHACKHIHIQSWPKIEVGLFWKMNGTRNKEDKWAQKERADDQSVWYSWLNRNAILNPIALHNEYMLVFMVLLFIVIVFRGSEGQHNKSE